MSNRRVTFQITLDLRAVMLLSVALLLLGLIMAPNVAGAFPRSDDPEPQAYDANNADKVDRLHASKRPKANTLLALKNNKKFPASVIPAYTRNQSNARFLNDDLQETISAAVTGGALLTVDNTGTGASAFGVDAFGEDRGLCGHSDSGLGVYAYSISGTGVHVYSSSGLPLRVTAFSGSDLIAAYDASPSPDNLRFRVTRSGNVRADGTFQGGGADFAEMMPVDGQPSSYEPGDLLVLSQVGLAQLSSSPNATNIVGVYSTKPAFLGAAGESEEEEDDRIPVAITGIVPVKASVENGAILSGDLLTSSSIPGHAMKASPVTIEGTTFYLPGTILGKALEPLEKGTGVILVLVTLQ